MNLAVFDSQSVTQFSGDLVHNRASSSSDARALQKASSGRIAACKFQFDAFQIDLNFTDANTHQCGLYLLDWDAIGRAQRIYVFDANGALLDTQVVSSFDQGVYLFWNLSGDVSIVVRAVVPGSTVVVSGLFFDPAGVVPPPFQLFTHAPAMGIRQ